MRTFQFSDASSHKFWSIDVRGAKHVIKFGKVGAAGQTQEKTFASPEAAQAEADKLVREKTKKGYAETTSKAATTGDALENAIRANPDDRAAHAAYADYLTEQGDPRGEFIQVQLALEDASLTKARRPKLQKKEADLLKTHEREWLGPLAPFLLDAPPPVYSFLPKTGHAFRRGWLDEVSLARLGVEAARALVQCREARLVRRLGVAGTPYEAPEGVEASPYIDGRYAPGPDLPNPPGDYPGYHVFMRYPHFAAVRVFRLGDPPRGADEDAGQCHTDGSRAHHYVRRMPDIEELYLLAHQVDADQIYRLRMPRLRVLLHYHAHGYPLEKLAKNPSLTNLTHLLCHPHAMELNSDHAYIRLPQLRAVCRSKHLTALTHLRLRLTDFGDAGAQEIVKSGVLTRLKVLDLTGGCVTDKGAAVLASSPDIGRLDRLNLNSNALTADGVRALEAAGAKLTAEGQHTEVAPFGPGNYPEYLFHGDME